MVRHLYKLYGPLWPLCLAPALFLAVLVVLGADRIEHWAAIVGITVLAVTNRHSRDLLLAVLPGVSIALGYETVRWLRPLFITPERVLGCELHRADAFMFGFGSGLAPPDLFATYHSFAADLFFAFPYTVFWVVVMAWSVVLFFVNRALLRRFLWTLALVHLAAFVVWLAFPVAPPWYVRLAGCAIDINAAPSAAALARLDAAFGITYFEAFYSRAPTVFGAMPSLHVAFPTVALVTGWQAFSRAGRGLGVVLVIWMLVASVYLDHHWLLDGVASIALTVAMHAGLKRCWPAYRAIANPTS